MRLAFANVPTPSAHRFIEPPDSEIMMCAVAPDGRMLTNELDFWKEKLTNAKGEATRLIAESNIEIISKAGLSRLAIGRALNGVGSYDERVVGAHYVRALHVVSHARLMRELMEQPTYQEEETPTSSEEARLLIDFWDRDIRRSGIHVRPNYFVEHINKYPPAVGETRWYEGEAIFLRAKRPADPTTNLEDRFKEKFKERIKHAQFISIVPLLKTSFWSVV